MSDPRKKRKQGPLSRKRTHGARRKNKISTEKGKAEHAPIRGEEQTEDGPQHGWDDLVWEKL